MRIKLFAASMFTLTILFGFVASIALLISWQLEIISPAFLIIFTIIINFLAWLVGPYIQTFFMKWLYKMEFHTLEEFEQQDAEITQFIREVCKSNNIKIPKLGYIEDDNPTAFTFGSASFNARIVVTQGLWTYLDSSERKAVIAHELGHIVHKDFIVMTIAATLVQILFELYQITSRLSKSKGGGNNKGKGAAASIALVSFIFYYVSQYILLYLSRTREYYADEFATKWIKHPDNLSMAFIKIGYGIVAKKDSDSGRRLIDSTRALGLADSRVAKNVGLAYSNLKARHDLLDNVLLFDLVNPWAKVLELASTHPLTGKRIRRLSEIAKEKGLKSIFDFDEHLAKEIDYKLLYNNFYTDIFIYFLPMISILIFPIAGLLSGVLVLFPLTLVGIGIGILLQTTYKYPTIEPTKTNILSIMSNIYSSPLRGTPVLLEGKVVGRGIPGYVFSEDLMFQDKTGLMYLNYESAIPLIGNLLFALTKVKALIGQKVNAKGWFLRGVTQHIDLNYIKNGSEVKSYFRLWSFIGGYFLIFIGTVLVFFLLSV